MEVNESKIKLQVCIIKIVFPVESDDSAIDYKKKIAALLVDLPDVNIQFSLMAGPPPSRPPGV